MVYLSYILDKNTPTYGNRNKFDIVKKSDMSKGDVANDTTISTTVHVGTHIDMPYHFYEDGQTVDSYSAEFWMFSKVLFLDMKPKTLMIRGELINLLEDIKDIGYDILVVKTGICHNRDSEDFWNKNYGFHPDIYDFLVENFPSIRVLGFDSISVSSFQDRMMGRESHKRFLNPIKPILLLEDMDLQILNKDMIPKKIMVSPLRISNCDGLPCTVFGILYD